MKKFMPFLVLMLFLSIISCDSSNDDLVDAKNVEKLNKQKQILNKLEELGIDPKDVTFTDNIVGEKIIVKSIEDLEKIFPKSINQENIELEEFTNKSSSKVANDNVAQYTHFASTITVPGQSMSIYYEFFFYRWALDYDSRNAINGVSAFTIGGNGVDYYIDNYDFYRNLLNYVMTINGNLRYPISIDGQNASITRPAKIVCNFNPNSNFSYIPHQHLLILGSK